MSGPNVLVLGGVGFIGRTMVEYLVNKGCCASIRVVDKVLPQTAFLSEAHTKAFEKVEYRQANLTSDAGLKRAFDREDGQQFNIVLNFAAETKYGQTDDVYKEKVFDLTTKVAAESLKRGVKRFVELSTAQIYDCDNKKPSKENGKLKPFTAQARFKLQAEESLKTMEGLPWVILRPACVYGPGDATGVAPRVICGAVYKHLGEKMKFLWSDDLRLHTVHVADVCAAVWHCTTDAVKPCSIFNLADKSDTTQGKISKHLETIFGIRSGFYGSLMSKAASMSLKAITEEANDKHLKPWSDLCRKSGISNTPLTPYLDTELLSNNALCIDGSAIEATGFVYSQPQLTEEGVRSIIKYYADQKLFPTMS
jgi:nucleoside-diphosphate-sugar epimerase